MIKTKKWLSGILAVLLCCMMMPIVTASAGELTSFPVINTSNPDNPLLVADEKTEYITLLSQNPVTKMITATIQIKHGGDAGSDNLVLDGIGIELSFNDKVAPCEYTIGTIFTGKTLSGSEFEKYAKALIPTFKNFGSMIVQNNPSGRFITAKLSCSNVEDRLIIPPGQTVSVAELYFMPVNGTDTLTSGMFRYEYKYQDFLRCTAWIALGTYSMQFSGHNTNNTQTYMVSPNSFKIRTAQQLAEIRAVKTGENLTSTDGKTRVGDIIKYTIKVSNVGKDGSVLVNAGLYDTISQYVDFIVGSIPFSTPYSWSYNTATREFIVHLGDIAKGQEKTVTFNVVVKESASGRDITSFVTVNGRDGNDSDADLLEVTVNEDTNPDTHTTVFVTFDKIHDIANLGGNPTKTVPIGQHYGTLPSPSMAGAYFAGWWTRPSGGKQITQFSLVDQADCAYDQTEGYTITLYAHWVTSIMPPPDPIYYVDFHSNYAPEYVVTVAVSSVGIVGAENIPVMTRTGFNLMGWNTSPYGTGDAFTANTIVSGNMSVYAQWEPSGGGSYLPGDINRDGDVNILDLSILLANFGKSGIAIADMSADINEDGDVNILDLSILLANFGKRLVT